MKGFSRLALGFVAVLGMTVWTGAAAASTAHGPAGYYLALGDSVAAGYQTPDIPTDRACSDVASDATGQRGYACLLWRQLRKTSPNLRLKSLALAVSPGEDSCSFIGITNCEGQKTRVDAASGDTAPFNINSQSQLSVALAFIKSHHVSVISLGLGGNDFLPLLHVAETQGPAQALALLPAVQRTLATNLFRTVGALRQADPRATLLLADQYNPISGLPASALGPNGAAILKLADGALATFAHGIKKLAKATGSVYVDEFKPFEGIAPGVTWITVGQNIHPNAQGYEILHQAFGAAWADAKEKLFIKVKDKRLVHPGALQTFDITTLPNAKVQTTLSYVLGGWKTTATMTGVAGLDGTVTFTWQAPNLVSGVAVQRFASGTKVHSASCSRYKHSRKCKGGNFIIA